MRAAKREAKFATAASTGFTAWQKRIARQKQRTPARRRVFKRKLNNKRRATVAFIKHASPRAVKCSAHHQRAESALGNIEMRGGGAGVVSRVTSIVEAKRKSRYRIDISKSQREINYCAQQRANKLCRNHAGIEAAMGRLMKSGVACAMYLTPAARLMTRDERSLGIALAAASASTPPYPLRGRGGRDSYCVIDIKHRVARPITSGIYSTRRKPEFKMPAHRETSGARKAP